MSGKNLRAELNAIYGQPWHGMPSHGRAESVSGVCSCPLFKQWTMAVAFPAFLVPSPPFATESSTHYEPERRRERGRGIRVHQGGGYSRGTTEPENPFRYWRRTPTVS